MKSPIKFENDWHEHSRAEKVILVVVFVIIALVVISWTAQGFASSGNDIVHAAHLVTTKIEYNQRYNTGVND